MKNSRRILIKLAFCAILVTQAGCEVLAIGGAAVGGYFLGKDERPISIIASDAVVTSSVKSKFIQDDQIKAFDINVDTYNGKVTLIGHAESSNLIDRAIALAEGVEGVTSVKSHLIVIQSER